MTWEYLKDDRVDKRFDPVVKFLKGKTKDKVIVDLDCLEARLLKFIPHDFKLYVGNDIAEGFPDLPKTQFFMYPDDQFVGVCPKCDILCCFGHGGYEKTGQQLESHTLTNSIKRLIERDQPQIVVLEAVQEFEDIISKIVCDEYELKVRKYINVGDDWVLKRVVYIYELRPQTAIVVGCYSSYDFLKGTIKTMIENTQQKFRIIGINQVRDKKTGEKTKSVFKKYLRNGDTYIENDPPLNIYQFWNQGIKEALKDKYIKYIGIFNDDLVMPVKWLENFLFFLRQDYPLVFADWTEGSKIPDNWEKLSTERANGHNTIYKDIMAGFCFICPRRTFENFGLFNENFKIWGGDTDFYYRLRENGQDTYRIENVLIHHYYSRTLNERRKNDKIDKILIEDKKLVNKMWNKDCPITIPPLKP